MAELLSAIGPGPGRTQGLEPELVRALATRTALAVSSGKAALTLVLRALATLTRRTKVIVPAYTCYSVPSAVVMANLEVVPCDVEECAFDYDYRRLGAMLDESVLGVVSVHLLGIPSDTARLAAMCRGKGIFVVEDAAQAFGGVARDGRPLGTLGDAGVFSFGRGKNITSGGGGAIVTGSEDIGRALEEIEAHLGPPPSHEAVETLMALALLSCFISPWLYWLPAGLPFLHLGETIFHESFPLHWMSDVQARLLGNWRPRLAALEAIRREHATYYTSRLFGDRASRQPAVDAGDVPFLRYPVLLPAPATRDHLLVERGGRDLGMSAMYPGTVGAIPQLAGRLWEYRFPNAESLASRLVTLPTHPLVSARDRSAIGTLVQECLRSDYVADWRGAERAG